MSRIPSQMLDGIYSLTSMLWSEPSEDFRTERVLERARYVDAQTSVSQARIHFWEKRRPTTERQLPSGASRTVIVLSCIAAIAILVFTVRMVVIWRTSGADSGTQSSVPIADELLVITPNVGIGGVSFGATKQDVINTFGEPDRQETSQDSREILRYDSHGFWIVTDKDQKVIEFVCHAYPENVALAARTYAGKTDEGIGMRASRSEIVKAYGPPDAEVRSDNRKILRMSYWKAGIEFTLQDDAVSELWIWRNNSRRKRR